MIERNRRNYVRTISAQENAIRQNHLPSVTEPITANSFSTSTHLISISELEFVIGMPWGMPKIHITGIFKNAKKKRRKADIVLCCERNTFISAVVFGFRFSMRRIKSLPYMLEQNRFMIWIQCSRSMEFKFVIYDLHLQRCEKQCKLLVSNSKSIPSFSLSFICMYIYVE